MVLSNRPQDWGSPVARGAAEEARNFQGILLWSTPNGQIPNKTKKLDNSKILKNMLTTVRSAYFVFKKTNWIVQDFFLRGLVFSTSGLYQWNDILIMIRIKISNLNSDEFFRQKRLLKSFSWPSTLWLGHLPFCGTCTSTDVNWN